LEAVTVTEVRILSDSGRTDYVLAGEGVTLSCLYLLQKEETVRHIVWEKDDEATVYMYDMYNQRATPYSPLKAHVDPENSSPTTIALKNVSKELYGRYVCRVVTDLAAQSQSEAVLVVIVGKYIYAHFLSHLYTSDYERSKHSCSALQGTYIRSLVFDRIEKRSDGTYEISLFRRFSVDEFLQFPGQVSFHCYLLVVSTTWRRGVHHKMFGEAGCVSKIKPVKNGYYNLTSEKTCWNTPREGSRLTYGCNDNYELEGVSEYVCSNGDWKAVINETSNEKFILASQSDALQGPVCSKWSLRFQTLNVSFLP
ncbi:hypothetical protein B4U80_09486, partial [Leptotrombidium deliense]